MNCLSRSLSTLALALALALPGLAAADGPSIFKEQKCTGCHSVTVAGINRDAGAEDTGPDLSKVGASLDKRGIALFLLKKSEIKGEKHKRLFGGTTEELKTLAEWLETLK